jgi:predicted dehydrogenase
MSTSRRLGIGFIGSGFMTRFHLQSFQGVRDADVLGIWSPNPDNASSAAREATALGLGSCRAFSSLAAMVAAPEIDAIWICGPNDRRLEHAEEIAGLIERGKGSLVGLCCEKPLARNVAEARRMLSSVQRTGLLHGYLENQVFTPALARGKEVIWRRGAAVTGRPYLARTAEEHSGPHKPWFWQGSRQGGGVLNDMLCHSVEAGRFLLTAPGMPRSSLKLKSVSAQIASLKWTRPRYASLLRERMDGVDYEKAPAEDFARATLVFADDEDNDVVLEASTSWSFVGPGLRLTFELLGPEYALEINSLDTSCKIYFSREVRGEAGEDLVEKQNAEGGLLPLLENEPAYYGYEAENRHMVRSFLAGRQPDETWEDGLQVVEILMACYQSAEERRTLDFPPAGLGSFVPAVARGAWSPRG